MREWAAFLTNSRTKSLQTPEQKSYKLPNGFHSVAFVGTLFLRIGLSLLEGILLSLVAFYSEFCEFFNERPVLCCGSCCEITVRTKSHSVGGRGMRWDENGGGRGNGDGRGGGRMNSENFGHERAEKHT